MVDRVTTSTLPHDLAEAADRLERLARRLGEDHGPLVRRLRGHAEAAVRPPDTTRDAVERLRALHAKRRALKAQIAAERTIR